MQRSEASGWSRGSAQIAAEEGERADRWGRPGSDGRRRAWGAERAGLERVGPRGLAGPSGMRGELGGSRAGPAWEKVKRWVGQGSKLGWVSFGFFFLFSFYFYLLSLFNSNSNKG